MFFAVLALAAVPSTFWRTLRDGKLGASCRARPYRTIALASVGVVALACHPVLFFGKSFVSPGYGSVLLYESGPTLPGDSSPRYEYTHDSDVGAMMWWHLYCPILAHDAMARDHELPLWNRYSMSGLPLLGQGQSMFGDPLNWLSILTRSAAWSWDARFLIVRWLLCCGLGLTACALTGSLSAGLLTAVAAGYLGFFEYRINHAANFSLGYSPWILFAWTGLIAAATWRGRARWCLALIAANFATMTSGTVKEAYMLIACLNLAGAALLWCADRTVRERGRALMLATAAGAVFVLVTAPLWLSFLFALKHSWTTYDQPAVAQINPALLIGFFESLFSRQLMPREVVYMPAMNFLFLLGLLAALVGWRENFARRPFMALGVAALLPLALVFGAIPASAIVRVPFLGNIVQINNVFSCPLIILTALLAAFGFAGIFGALRRHGRPADFALLGLLFGAILTLYLGSTQTTPKSDFFAGYAWSLALGLMVLPAGLRVATRKSDPALGAALLLAGVALLTWRQGQYLATPFDNYVNNPPERVELRPRSAAVDFIQARMQEPSRPIGFGINLFPGYNQMLGWESILGVDPLRSLHHDQLAAALGIKRVREADEPLEEADAPALRPGLDLMNVRYYLASPARVHPIPPLTFLGHFDLDVYESATAWPRAFFTDRLWRYEGAPQLAAAVRRGDGRPFAAAERGDRNIPGPAGALSSEMAGRIVRPADSYRLTANTTSFAVDAPSAGVIVLSETYYPHDFAVRVNGRRADYFRVNHAYRGVYVDAPGKYQVTFSYRQPGTTAALALAGAGLAGLLAFTWVALRRPPAGAGEVAPA